MQAPEGITFDCTASTWVTTTPWFIPATLDGERVWWSIPSGFVMDLASIPRFLWWKKGLAPFELSIEAPICHDWGYQHRGRPPRDSFESASHTSFTRREVDAMFHAVMRAEGVPRARARLAWLAVRLFGWWAWRSRR